MYLIVVLVVSGESLVLNNTATYFSRIACLLRYNDICSTSTMIYHIATVLNVTRDSFMSKLFVSPLSEL
jgi:hypothetical protein